MPNLRDCALGLCSDAIWRFLALIILLHAGSAAWLRNSAPRYACTERAALQSSERRAASMRWISRSRRRRQCGSLAPRAGRAAAGRLI